MRETSYLRSRFFTFKFKLESNLAIGSVGQLELNPTSPQLSPTQLRCYPASLLDFGAAATLALLAYGDTTANLDTYMFFQKERSNTHFSPEEVTTKQCLVGLL